jgi:hypothetical protein
MEIGRQGIAGNGCTSRVWKGDGQSVQPANIPSTDIGCFNFNFRLRNAECGLENLKLGKFEIRNPRSEIQSYAS